MLGQLAGAAGLEPGRPQAVTSPPALREQPDLLTPLDAPAT